MGKMTKSFTYKEYTISVLVELNTKAERHIGGKIWHNVTTTNITTNIELGNLEIEDTQLVDYITRNEITIKKYIDSLGAKSTYDIRLSELGFS